MLCVVAYGWWVQVRHLRLRSSADYEIGNFILPPRTLHGGVQFFGV
jgi:hypothetical protein